MGTRFDPGYEAYGGDGDDMLHGGLFDDKGDDTLKGSYGEDKLYGGEGNDTLEGSGSDDRLFGGDGDDTLDGGDGDDTLKGSYGDDTLYGGRTFDDLTITDNAKGHAVITGYGADASVTLKGVTASELTESDFEFLGWDLPRRNRRTGRRCGRDRGKAGAGGSAATATRRPAALDARGPGGVRVAGPWLNQRRQAPGRATPCERLSGTVPRTHAYPSPESDIRLHRSGEPASPPKGLLV